MQTEHPHSLISDADKYIDILVEVTGLQAAVDILQAAKAAGRPLTGAERETVTRSACRLAGILLDGARAAKNYVEDPDTITRAETAADDLIDIVNQLNGWTEESEGRNDG